MDVPMTVGQDREDNALELRLIWCPPGEFKMGSPASDPDAYSNEQPQVPVALSQGFWLGKSVVTQADWEPLMHNKPWQTPGNIHEAADYPATHVSWEDAIVFCEKLTDVERCAGRLPSDWEYSLPSEAQWEYACRAGTTTRFSFGDDEAKLHGHAWYNRNRDVGRDPAPKVGKRLPNPWGLHDMHGSLWEWCRDWYQSQLPGGPDPEVTEVASDRVVRGGSWYCPAKGCRSAARGAFAPNDRQDAIGFRLALVTR